MCIGRSVHMIRVNGLCSVLVCSACVRVWVHVECMPRAGCRADYVPNACVAPSFVSGVVWTVQCAATHQWVGAQLLQGPLQCQGQVDYQCSKEPPGWQAHSCALWCSVHASLWAGFEGGVVCYTPLWCIQPAACITAGTQVWVWAQHTAGMGFGVNTQPNVRGVDLGKI